MTHLNVEIKARCQDKDHDMIRNILKELRADFKGTDRQIDTYFKVPSGRLKLREGNIENHLIFYKREDKEDPKQSEIILFPNAPEASLKDILENALGVLVSVAKSREIYFIDNVKFHLDSVARLGTFVEIEAIDLDGSLGKETLYKQCEKYISLFGISSKDLISHSYSDMLLNQRISSIPQGLPA